MEAVPTGGQHTSITRGLYHQTLQNSAHLPAAEGEDARVLVRQALALMFVRSLIIIFIPFEIASSCYLGFLLRTWLPIGAEAVTALSFGGGAAAAAWPAHSRAPVRGSSVPSMAAVVMLEGAVC